MQRHVSIQVSGRVDLPLDGPPVLACGADLKSVFCVTRGRQAILSPPIGDLSEYASCQFYREAVDELLRRLQIQPAIVAHDLHPDYESTRFAKTFPAGRKIAVQHHHAHVAACMAEHGLAGPVIGVALDGSGYGPDGTVWGGEFLVADYAGYRRVGHFKPYRLPGGEGAIRHPPRMALSWLAEECGERADALGAQWLPAIPPDHRKTLLGLIASGAHSPWTSSAGRLFDAVSALLGLCDKISHEGQAAMRLQAAADRRESEALPVELEDRAGVVVLSFGPALRALLEQREAGVGIPILAARFHRAVAAAVAAVCGRLRDREGLARVVLSGGVFQNDLLLDWLTDALSAGGFEVYSHHQVSPTDAGLALGQAAVALAAATEH
ncbi:MAG: carbamoyltransferase HypF [Verrucomicrobia bacterium]|nr:carbamoyltransferase HypF [Verrucomicrobiota bacterium]MBU1908929.1 carbamoyltransferase HypF [Verrucomicrobiota bacterium]